MVQPQVVVVGGGGSPPPPPSKNQKKPKIIFSFSDRSYRNRQSHEIWGYLEAILRVLELIFGRVKADSLWQAGMNR